MGDTRSIGFVQKCGGSGTVLPLPLNDASANVGDFHERKDDVREREDPIRQEVS